MSTETDIIAAMNAAVTPAPVYRLHAPQLDDDHPSQVPMVVFTRELFDDQQFQAFCVTADGQTLNASYLVDCFALDYAEARRMMAGIIAGFKPLNMMPESVFEDWEPTTRVYRVSGSFTLWETGALSAP